MGRSKDIASGSKFVDTTGDTMTGALTGTSAGFTGDVNIGNNDSSNPLSKLRLGGTQYGAADIVPVSTGHKIGLDFKTDSTGDTTIDPVTRMSISNEGYVTMPYQPHISITIDNNGGINYTSATHIYARNDVIIDSQSGITHNTSNGRFTAPVAGRYYFSFYTITNGTGGASYINFLHNGTRRADAYDDTATGNWSTMSACAIYNMAANDYIDPVIQNFAKSNDIHGHFHSRFTMHLIG